MTGCAVSTLAWRMREPVISTRSRVVVVWFASCANAVRLQLPSYARVIAEHSGVDFKYIAFGFPLYQLQKRRP